MAVVLTFTGPSQCGKSTIIDMFLKSENEDFKPVLIPKYVTRDLRATDGNDVIGGGVPESCDLVYEQYGQRYGFHFNTLYEHLSKGNCPIVIVNDIKVLQDIKTALGSQVISIFMYRKQPVLQDFINEEMARFNNPTDEMLEKIKKTATTRYNKAIIIYRIYIENIALFDNVVLNVDTLENSKKQVETIINKIVNPSKFLKKV